MPWALAAAAVAAGANYMQQRDNNKNVQRQYNAKNEALAAGAAQQQPNIQQGQDILANTIKQVQPDQQNTDLGAAIANRTQAINANTTTPSSIADPTSNSSAPQVVQSNLANAMGRAAAYAKQQGGALGAIGGTQDAQLGTNLALENSGQQLNQLTNFAKGDAGVNSAKAEAAYNNARKAADPIWGMLGAGANAASMYEAGGGNIGSQLNQLPTSVGGTGYSFVPTSLPTGVQGPTQPSVWGSI